MAEVIRTAEVRRPTARSADDQHLNPGPRRAAKKGITEYLCLDDDPNLTQPGLRPQEQSSVRLAWTFLAVLVPGQHPLLQAAVTGAGRAVVLHRARCVRRAGVMAAASGLARLIPGAADPDASAEADDTGTAARDGENLITDIFDKVVIDVRNDLEERGRGERLGHRPLVRRAVGKIQTNDLEGPDCPVPREIEIDQGVRSGQGTKLPGERRRGTSGEAFSTIGRNHGYHSQLIPIEDRRTVITGISNAIIVLVALSRIVNRGAVVACVADTIGPRVGILLCRVVECGTIISGIHQIVPIAVRRASDETQGAAVVEVVATRKVIPGRQPVLAPRHCGRHDRLRDLAVIQTQRMAHFAPNDRL